MKFCLVIRILETFVPYRTLNPICSAVQVFTPFFVEFLSHPHQLISQLFGGVIKI